jgi:hypothetical protein
MEDRSVTATVMVLQMKGSIAATVCFDDPTSRK